MLDMVSAFGDESFHESADRGVYVLAAALIDAGDREQARELLQGLRGRRRTPKLHWHEMDHSERRHAAKRLAELDSLHLVVLAAPVAHRRQERARALCLAQLVCELHGAGIEQLYLESRAPNLNTADVRTVAGIRQSRLPKGTRFRVEHVPGPQMVELWAADIVAGICRAAQQTSTTQDLELRDVLAERIYDVHITGP